MPQPPAAYPPSGYDRALAASAAVPYVGYPRPYSRSPDYYPETAVTNNMVPSGRKASATGYYLPGQSPQDVSFHPISLPKSFISSHTVPSVNQQPQIVSISGDSPLRGPLISSGILPPPPPPPSHEGKYLSPPKSVDIPMGSVMSGREALLRRFPHLSTIPPPPPSSATPAPHNIYRFYANPAITTTTPSMFYTNTSPTSEHQSSYVGIRERAADLRSLSSMLRKTVVTRAPPKLTPVQMDKLMDDQISAFVGVVKKLYEWKDWIWWGSLKYLDLAKNRV